MKKTVLFTTQSKRIKNSQGMKIHFVKRKSNFVLEREKERKSIGQSQKVCGKGTLRNEFEHGQDCLRLK